MGDWNGMGAADLGRGIETGAIDPLDLAESFLAAIDDHPFGARIYARATPARARAEAQAARERARLGLRRSPLDGVPVSWKDLFDTAGVATEAGTALLRGRTPARDARVLANATAQGLVCLGKTHMTELAFSGLGLNPVTESPPCVNDHDAVSGGSSSGAATSVAFGLAAGAIGSDTGGSVRVPAAWNDLVGLKPASGRLSLEGVVPLAARFDTVGPLARTVEDAALLLAALEGRRPADLRGARATGPRLMNLTTSAHDDIRAEPARAHDDALARLRSAGVRIEDGDVPEVAEAMDLAGLLYTAETYGTWGHLIEQNPDAMHPPVRERFRAGRAHGAADFVAGWQRLDRLRAAYVEATADHDAVLVPTVALTPPKQADVAADQALFTSENLLTLRNTRIANLMGLAALTLPTVHPSCGLTLMGPPGSEARLLRLGAALAPVLT
jgi:aspartyl-tRNA(Asn)/glutamyl-tRNA(Gln) amidotransferase subunit A